MLQQDERIKQYDTNGCAQFFSFSSQEPDGELLMRLGKVRQKGFSHIIASYKTQGMAQVRFDDNYYNALDRLVRGCKAQDISFWLEDYAPFPTGSANGAYGEAEYADRNKLMIDERHMDIHGPVSDAVIRIDALQNACYGKAMHLFSKVDPAGRKRMAVLACRLMEVAGGAAETVIDDKTVIRLDGEVRDGYLKWNVPEGHWRIFVLFTTCESSGRPNFMNLLSRESVALEIEKVHRPLYEHLKAELGKTWIGFFYDEPEIGNDGGDKIFDFFMLPGRRTQAPTDIEVLPWSSQMPKEMERRDPDWLFKLPYLWYDGTGDHKSIRSQYMDAVSSLVRENYNGQVYAFCRERGIHYIGHVLEDESCHTRLGCGPSHYFRQQYFQDEAGIDVIAGQILPGKDGAGSWYGVINSDGEFYHYGLAKLASSEAHINPLKNGRTMAECFAMYGQQGLAEQKFLLDHLLINGINRMLFADLTSYQAPASYAQALAAYTNRMCNLLRASKTVIKTAILYHGEAEWAEGNAAQRFHRVGAVLAREQISYDVIPADVFTYPDRYNTQFHNGLTVNGNAYGALIIPYPGCADTSSLPEAVNTFIKQCEATGYPVFVTDGTLGNLHELPDQVRNAIHPDITIESEEKPWIRYMHLEYRGKTLYLIHNESPAGAAVCRITLAARGEVLAVDPYGMAVFIPEQKPLGNGFVEIALALGRYEMVILCDGHVPEAIIDSKYSTIKIISGQTHKNPWTLTLPDGHTVTSKAGALPCVADETGYGFYGKLMYKTTFTAGKTLPEFINLGTVSDCCEVFVNGICVGKRAAAPWNFDVRPAIKEGLNEITAQVYTSAGNINNPVKLFGIPMDTLTAVPYTLAEPMGISGPVKWLYEAMEAEMTSVVVHP